MKKNLIFLLSIVFLSGCTSARISKNISSGVIGCPANEITVKNEQATFNGLHTWVAECRGHQFICSYQETTGVNCVKSLEKDSKVL